MMKGNETDCICAKPNGKHEKRCNAYRLSEFTIKAASLSQPSPIPASGDIEEAKKGYLRDCGCEMCLLAASTPSQPLQKSAGWEDAFDSTFDYLYARHTLDQWDAYKAFIASLLEKKDEEIQSAYERGRVKGFNEGSDGAKHAASKYEQAARADAIQDCLNAVEKLLARKMRSPNLDTPSEQWILTELKALINCLKAGDKETHTKE